MLSIGTLGNSALGTQEPQGQAPSLPSQWFNRTEAARSSQPACYRQPSRCWSQGYTWMWLVGPRISKGATYSVLTSCSRVFFPQNCTILAATGKTINKKIHLSTSLLLGWTNIFPWVSSGPWVSNSLIGKRSFPAFEILQLLQIWWKML